MKKNVIWLPFRHQPESDNKFKAEFWDKAKIISEEWQYVLSINLEA